MNLTDVPLNERTLVRRLTFLEPEVIPALVDHDWETLTGWNEASNCRLTVETIVSCALRPQSPVYERAHNWLSRKENQTLVMAVSLHEVGLNPAFRSIVHDEIFDRHDIDLTEATRVIWRRLRQETLIPWGEIATACEVRPRYHLPPANRSDLHDACCRLLPDPTEVQLSNLVEEMLGIPKLAEMPHLQYAIALRHSAIPAERMQPHVASLARGLMMILTEPLASAGQQGRNESAKQNYFSARFEMAEWLVNHLDEDAPANKEKWFSRILELGELPWFWPVIDKLITKLPEDSSLWLKVPAYLKTWLVSTHLVHNEHSPYYNMYLGESFHVRTSVFIIKALVKFLPVPIAVALTKQFAGGDEERTFCEDLGAEYAELIAKDPDSYQSALAGIISEGKVSSYFLGLYLKGLGYERAKAELAGWLQNNPVSEIRYDATTSIMTDYVMPNRMSAGNKLSRFSAEGLCSGGYELQPEDVATEYLVLRLLPRNHLSGDKEQVLTSIWANEQWRDTLLRAGHAGPAILQSFLLSLTKIPRDERDSVLLPYLAEHDYLWQALCQVAWEGKYESDQWRADARLLLVRDARLPACLQDETQRRRVKKYLKEHGHQLITEEVEVVSSVATKDEQLGLFFQSVLDDEDTADYLPDPSGYEALFADAQTRKALRGWLLVHEHRISSRHWIKWVTHFQLSGDRRIRERLRRYLYTSSLSTVDEVIAALAAA